MIGCICGFVAAPTIAPDSAEYHRQHRQAHLTRFPNVDAVTIRALDRLVALAERGAIAGTTRAIDIACPRCGAAAGAQCVSQLMPNTPSGFHRERVSEAVRDRAGVAS